MGCVKVGDVDGSTPNWRLANLGDHGVRRTIKPREALSSNWTAWTMPLGASSATARRGLDSGISGPETYRCHMHRVVQEQRPERREGIKLVRPLERHVKTTAVHQCPKDNSLQGPEQRQPCTMKLGRDYAMPCTAQCDKELTFEEEITRKGRMNLEGLRNSGRAGDMTTVRGTRDRVEEDWAYAHKAIDSPAYTRFAASVGYSGTAARTQGVGQLGPHSLAARARDDERDVRSLEQWTDEKQPECASV